MKSFARLVKNELIKMFAQTAYKVLFFIMIALFIIIPLISKGFDKLINEFDEIELIDAQIEIFEENIKTADDELDKKYYQIHYDCLSFMKEQKLDTTSWQYRAMFSDYLGYSLTEYIYGELSNGNITMDEASGSIFLSYVDQDIPKEAYQEAYNQMKQKRQEYEGLIANATINDFYKKYYDELGTIIDDCRTYLGSLKIEKMHGSPNKSIDYEIKIYEYVLEACEMSRSIYKDAMEENVEYGSWKYNTATTSYTVAMYIGSISAPRTEEAYYMNVMLMEEYDSYEKYLDAWNNELEDQLNIAKALKFSFENDIPTQAMQSNSSKGVFITTLTGNIQYILYFMIVISALIVANEFSSGSARLLFVRPHSRNKILMSKYSCVMILLVALNIVNILMSFLFAIMFNGVGDIFASNIAVVDGVARKSSMLLHLLGTVALANFRVIFVTTFTFMLSALCKKGALGIVVGILGDIIVSVISDLSIGEEAMKFTPFPYYQGEIFALNKIDTLLLDYTNNLSLSTVVNFISNGMSHNLSVWGAIGNFVFWMAICLTTTLLVFRKQEIKN